MNHELNIGTISGYSADELVNRIADTTRYSSRILSWTDLEDGTTDTGSAGFNGKQFSSYAKYISWPSSITSLTNSYDIIKFDAKIIISGGINLSGNAGYSTDLIFSMYFNGTYNDGPTRKQLYEVNKSSTVNTFNAGETLPIYLRRVYDSSNLSTNYMYRLDESDDWAYTYSYMFYLYIASTTSNKLSTLASNDINYTVTYTNVRGLR